MTADLFALSGVLVLAIVHILAFDIARTAQYGLKWNMSPRDQKNMPELSDIAKRLERAQANFYETFPIYIGAVLTAHVTGQADHITEIGANVYFLARLLYLPLYAYGLSPWRSLVWVASFIGLLMIIWRLFF
jgi:uncharacterized MAPEG superfamily protein